MDLLDEMLKSHGWYPLQQDEQDAYITISEKAEKQ